MYQRIITGLVLGTGGVALIYFGGVPFAVAALVCLCFALSEEFRALSVAGHRPVPWPTWIAMAVSIPLGFYVGAKVVIPILLAASALIIACVLFREEPRLEDALMSLLPLYSIVLPGLAMVSLSLVSPLSVQRTLLAMLIAVPVLGDTAAYFVGSAVRGPKFCPAVSPNKTWAGAIAGLAGSLLTAVIIRTGAGWMVSAPTTELPTWWACIGLGIVGGVVSQLGDLFASMVKRHCEIKDFSSIFPGHGGMMDRLDSILFMALVLFCYRLLWYPY